MRLKWVGWEPIADASGTFPTISRIGRAVLHAKDRYADRIFRFDLIAPIEGPPPPPPTEPPKSPLLTDPKQTPDLFHWSGVRIVSGVDAVARPAVASSTELSERAGPKTELPYALFATDRDRRVHYCFRADPQYDNAWTPVPGDVPTDVGPAVTYVGLASPPRRTLYVFASHRENQGIYVRELDMPSLLWTANAREVPGGGRTLSAPAVAFVDVPSRPSLQLFVRGLDDTPWFTSGVWIDGTLAWNGNWKPVPAEGAEVHTQAPLGVTALDENVFIFCANTVGDVCLNLYRPSQVGRIPGGRHVDRIPPDGAVKRPGGATQVLHVPDVERIPEPDPWSGWNLVPAREGVRFGSGVSAWAFHEPGSDALATLLLVAHTDNGSLYWNRGKLTID